MPSRVWVYVRVYVHDRPEMLDWIVVAVLPRIREQLGAARWFYLRYFDRSGIHLRVRFEVPAADAARVQAYLAETLTVPYAVLDAERFGGLDWFFPPLRPARTAAETETAVVPDTYLPEHGTYGLAQMTVAEDLFHRSSELASSELCERRDAGPSYAKSIALRYMDAVREAFAPDEDEETFWTGYREFWLDGVENAPAWRALIARQAERACASLAMPAPSPRVQLWSAELRDAAARYAGRAGELAVRQFIHLTNNRLGITYLEEAYLAQLLISLKAVAR